jgi:hypothetical protein
MTATFRSTIWRSSAKTKRYPLGGQQNLAKSSAREWIKYTTVITAHIAHGQSDAVKDELAVSMHKFWCEQNDGPGCGWARCTQAAPGFWIIVAHRFGTRLPHWETDLAGGLSCIRPHRASAAPRGWARASPHAPKTDVCVCRSNDRTTYTRAASVLSPRLARS